MNAPYIHTNKKGNERAKNWLVALIPIIIWSVYVFGGRVISLCAICASACVILDYPIRRYLFKYARGTRIDLMAIVYAVLATFCMPVSVPLWLPTVAAILIVFAKNISVFRPKMLFNPYIFSAAVLNFAFPTQMTAFTKPFAYFGAFDVVIDQRLMDGYRVLSPLQYIADGSVYEDGLAAQLYGFASGNLGEIAIAAIILAAVWLWIRKELDITATAAFLITILVVAMCFPSEDAESNHYAYSILLSGGIALISVFALNDRHTVPLTSMGRLFLALFGGAAVFAVRKYGGGFEWSYCVILAINAISPLVERVTKPKPIVDSKKPDKKEK